MEGITFKGRVGRSLDYASGNLELRHPRCVYNIKVQCKSKHKLIVTVLLIEHVSTYSEAIIRFNKL